MHSITPKQSIYDVTSTLGMETQPLYQTSHTLYLSQHTFSNDISPTIVWHHTHLQCDIIWTIYNFTKILMPSYYCTYDITDSIYDNTSSMRATYTLNMWHHSHYLGHDIYIIGNITPTLFMTWHSPYVWHRVHYTRHHILTFWPQTILLGSSHPLY